MLSGKVSSVRAAGHSWTAALLSLLFCNYLEAVTRFAAGVLVLRATACTEGGQHVLLGVQVSSRATPDMAGRGASADGFGSVIGSRQTSPPDPLGGNLSRQTSVGRQPLAPLPSVDR